jgi:hypothetical protein
MIPDNILDYHYELKPSSDHYTTKDLNSFVNSEQFIDIDTNVRIHIYFCILTLEKYGA